MCIEDVKLGRKKTYRSRQVLASAGIHTRIADFAKERTFIRIGTIDEDINICTDPLGRGGFFGYLVTTTKPDFEARIEDYGIAVTDTLWVYVPGAVDANVIVTEVYLEDR